MVMMFFLLSEEQGWITKFRRPVAGPRGNRSHYKSTQYEQDAVIVDPPAGEIVPGLFTVGFDREAGLLQFIDHFIILFTRYADRCGWIVRVLGIRDIEIIC